MNSFRKLTLLSVSLAGVFFSGCSSVELDPQGSMVAVHSFGNFQMLLNSTAPAATTVAQRVLPQFDLYQTGTESTTYSSRITARNRADQQILIEIEEVNSRQSLLRIRWGKGGDKELSRRLYEAIEAGLSTR